MENECDLSELINDFEKRCKRIHDEREEQREKNPIYHYTTYEGIKGILETRRLYHTDYRYFNDPTEIKYGQGIIIETLLESDIDIEHKKLLIQVLNDFFNNFDSQMSIYICCFSAKIDELALWRYYASNGTGFAIGFKDISIVNSPNLVKKPFRVITKVMYKKDESKEILNKFIHEHLEILDKAKKLIPIKNLEEKQFYSFLSDPNSSTIFTRN